MHISESGFVIPTFEQDQGKHYLTESAFAEAILDLTCQVHEWQDRNGLEITRIGNAPRGSMETVSRLSQALGFHGSSVFQHALNFRDAEGNIRFDYDDGMPISTSDSAVQEATAELVEGQVVLWPDDLSHTGWTEFVAKSVLTKLGAKAVVSCNIFYNEGDNQTGVPPDIYWQKTDRWVVFPWERFEEFGVALNAARNQGATEEELSQLKQNFLKATQV